MRLRTLAWLLALFGCDDGERFLPINELCAELAVDICEARDGCCGGVDKAGCQAAETTRCEAELDPFGKEAALGYDAVAASRTRSAARTMLDVCGPLPSLAGFFEGGLPLGTACERSTQCASGLCTGQPGSCTEAPALLLCPAAVP